MGKRSSGIRRATLVVAAGVWAAAMARVDAQVPVASAPAAVEASSAPVAVEASSAPLAEASAAPAAGASAVPVAGSAPVAEASAGVAPVAAANAAPVAEASTTPAASVAPVEASATPAASVAPGADPSAATGITPVPGSSPGTSAASAAEAAADAVAAGASPAPADEDAAGGAPDPAASPDPFHGLDLIMTPKIAPHLLLEPQTKRDPFIAPAGVPFTVMVPVKPPPTAASTRAPAPVRSGKPAPAARPSRIRNVNSLAISGVMFGQHLRAVRIGGKRVHEGEWFDIVGGQVSIGDGGEFQVQTITPTRIVFTDRTGKRLDRDTSLRRQRVTAAPAPEPVVDGDGDAGGPGISPAATQ